MGEDAFGAHTISYNVRLHSSASRLTPGLEMWNTSLQEVLFSLLRSGVATILATTEIGESQDRLINLNFHNSLLQRSVETSILEDNAINRLALIRQLLEELMLAVNSSDSHTSFQEFEFSITARFPDKEINDLDGNGLKSGERRVFQLECPKTNKFQARKKKGDSEKERGAAKTKGLRILRGLRKEMLGHCPLLLCLLESYTASQS